ncbi:MAG: hypothetical protein ABIH50_02945 [bacterium]
MSELASIIYKSLNLPYPNKGERLLADYNDLTKKVDGNTDSYIDGKIDDKDKNGFVEPEELLEEILGNRSRYKPVMEKLNEAGMDDPFEESEEISAFVKKLFKRYVTFPH